MQVSLVQNIAFFPRPVTIDIFNPGIFNNTSGSVNELGTLDPGNYTLQLIVRSRVSSDDINAPLSDSAYADLSFKLIPTPSTAGVLALGGLVATRRRRR